MLNYLELREKRIRERLIPKPIKKGSGLINSLIDNMPIEAHLPGMQYAGPGTNLDLKLLQGVKPSNKLDAFFNELHSLVTMMVCTTIL